GLLLSMYLVKLTSCTLTLPAPAPPPVCAEPEFDMPQLQASTSISSLCVLSLASPLSSPILMNMSTAMTISSEAVRFFAACVGRGQPPGLLSLVSFRLPFFLPASVLSTRRHFTGHGFPTG